MNLAELSAGVFSTKVQARRFQMAVNVEGSGGWADRQRHLLLSGMVVLNQQVGVHEWWEPLLRPYAHYVPVDSRLRNLSDAVQWVRQHQAEARAMARDAAETLEEALSLEALAAYSADIFRGVAALDAQHRPSQPDPSRPPFAAARFECTPVPDAGMGAGAVGDDGEALLCSFVAADGSGKRTRGLYSDVVSL